MKNSIIFLDGQWLRADQQCLDCLAPWRLSGRGVFETMRVHKGVILFWPAHWQRLQKSLKILRLKNPYLQKKWEQQLRLLLTINNLSQGRLRLTVWRDQSQVHACIMATPLEKIKRQMFRVMVFPKRMKIIAATRRVKSIDYKFFVNAYQAAQGRGFDEAIILNQRKEVAEASRSNIFLVKDGCLLTPSLASGGLKGIVRQVVLHLARRKGLRIKETRLYLQDLQIAEEIFLTNSIVGVIPVVAVNDQKIYHGRLGSWTKRLQTAYKEEAKL